ncbi:MAG: tetratricopeptide repeat protein [Treponema sp.]|nr:tetratricopeptide repeat protein [Treponema sp.]
MINSFRLLSFFFLAALLVFSCKTAPVQTDTDVTAPAVNNDGRQSSGIADEIRSLTETGVLSLMAQALELIRARELGGVDFGRVMNAINALLIRLVYPDSRIRLSPVDLPQTHNYSKIIRDAERGNYISPNGESTDFFEYILPFLAFNHEAGTELPLTVIDDLSMAAALRPHSVLPSFFLGLVNERNGLYKDAEAAYRKAYDISGECYPALTGIARVMRLSQRVEDAAALLSDLVIHYPDSLDIKRQLAITLYENRDWSRAGPAVDEILQNDQQDGEFILMKARILIEQGLFSQAQPPLDAYAAINPNKRDYLFLRARVQAEGNRNRDAALNYLRSILRANPDDEEALIYAASLLLESQRPADQTEGRELLARLQQPDGSSVEVLSLSLRDAVHRENWREAQGFLNSILAVRRNIQDLTDGYYVERGLGNNAKALGYARELYDKDTSNNEYIAVYISALIDNGRNDEASKMLETRLAASTGAVKSRFFFLRSRIQSGDDAVLGDLRSSLFEDPRNLQALIAMFEYYHKRYEERRAVYYLRQALAIAPDNTRLKRYEREYASLLER